MAAAERTRSTSKRTTWIVVVVVIAIGAALVVTLASGPKKDPTHGTGALPAPKDLVAAVTSIPKSAYDRVGPGTADPLPKKLPGPPLSRAGKPRIVYIGAEFCPFCATERWALVAALSRFGTFERLKTSHSSALDTFPNTQTLSFYTSTYTSPYLIFEGVEQLTNIQSGGSYSKLEDLTAEQQRLMNTYDAPPYVDTTPPPIPFIDFANQYVIAGATYAAGVLQGKSAMDIADAMRDPSTAIGRGALGSANVITAALCNVTGDKPASVCSDPVIAAIQRRLH